MPWILLLVAKGSNIPYGIFSALSLFGFISIIIIKNKNVHSE